MNILITGAASRLGQALAADLLGDHKLRLLDSAVPEELCGDAEVVQGSLADPEIAWKAVRNIDVVLHTGEPPQDLSLDPLECEQELLDLATRGTHVLFKAGVEAGVDKFVYASSLEIFAGYPDTVYISEYHKPLPGPEMGCMSRYMGELTCREFARDYPITVTALRLGRLVLEEEVVGCQEDLQWVDLRDVVQAFRQVLRRDASAAMRWASRWAIYHICAPLDNPKFLISQAERMGYQPTHNFRSAGGA